MSAPRRSRLPVLRNAACIRRVPSQSTLSRFFAGFRSAGANPACFRPLWRWGLDRLPSRRDGYALDLDSTRLLHEDGHHEGVRTCYPGSIRLIVTGDMLARPKPHVPIL